MGEGGRHEFKYVIEETRARAIAGFVRSHLQPSPFNRPGLVPGESVVSLYLDSSDLLFYRQAATGQKNRMKLRIRFYDNDEDQPAFLEIKRRVSDVICKERAVISREAVRDVLRNRWSQVSPLQNGSGADCRGNPAAVLQHFAHLCSAAQARAVLYTTYIREAFIGNDGRELRVTFDRQILASRYTGEEQMRVPRHGIPLKTSFLPPNNVVLELKFNGGYPRWMQQMVGMFNLHRRSVSKYCACVEAMGLPLGQHGQAIPQKWIVA